MSPTEQLEGAQKVARQLVRGWSIPSKQQVRLVSGLDRGHAKGPAGWAGAFLASVPARSERLRRKLVPRATQIFPGGRGQLHARCSAGP